MGKNAQRKRGEQPNQPTIDHFILGIDPYVAIRRYLGSRPHDETRELIAALEALPVVTEPDMELRAKQGKRLAELEALELEQLATIDDDIDELKRMASAGEPFINVNHPADFPNEEIEEAGLMTTPDPDDQSTPPHGTVVGDILDDGTVVGDDPVDKQPEEDQ